MKDKLWVYRYGIILSAASSLTLIFNVLSQKIYFNLVVLVITLTALGVNIVFYVKEKKKND